MTSCVVVCVVGGGCTSFLRQLTSDNPNFAQSISRVPPYPSRLQRFFNRFSVQYIISRKKSVSQSLINNGTKNTVETYTTIAWEIALEIVDRAHLFQKQCNFPGDFLQQHTQQWLPKDQEKNSLQDQQKSTGGHVKQRTLPTAKKQQQFTSSLRKFPRTLI